MRLCLYVCAVAAGYELYVHTCMSELLSYVSVHVYVHGYSLQYIFCYPSEASASAFLFSTNIIKKIFRYTQFVLIYTAGTHVSPY